ncbi:MAG: alanine racemase, partial [Planctomycetota bacterium]
VARMVSRADLIHSVDSLRLLHAIDASAGQAGKQQKILLEVNVSGESSKHGFTSAELSNVLEEAASLPGVFVSGLMCMAGLRGSIDDARREFELLRQLRDSNQTANCDNIALTELSMGMSGDFEAAIEQGATIVRIGSILFENNDRSA